MKVLHIGKFYPPDKGGIETATKAIIDHLWDSGVDCDAVCFSHGESCTISTPKGTVHRFKTSLNLLSTPFSLGYLWFLLRKIQAYDVIHVHTPNPLSALFVFLMRPRQKVIVHWHSDVVNQRRAYILFRPFEKMLLIRANKILVGTEEYFSGSEPLQAHRRKVRFLSYSTHAHPAAPRQEIPETIRVLTVGRMVKYKGYDDLIRAAKFLAPNVQVTLIGKGPELDSLRTLISQLNLTNVEILTDVEDLTPYFESADIFCLPSISRAESFGISLIEALSFGLPLVTTEVNYSGMKFINQHRVTGLVVPPRAPEALAEAINQLVADHQLRHDLGVQGHKRFHEYFENSKVLPKFIELYRSAHT